MKKYLFALVLATSIIPSVAFASWWNPLSWFNSWSFSSNSNEQTRVLENRISELEKKLVSQTPTTTTSTSTYQELLNAKQEKANAIRAALSTSTTINTTPTKKTDQPIDNSALIQAQVKAQVEATLKAKAEQDALITQQNRNAQVQTNLATCTAINTEQGILAKNLGDSLRYFQYDLIPVFSSKMGKDFSTQYNELSYGRSSFFQIIDNFKNVDIARIKSSYLDSNYIQSIRDSLTTLSDAYRDMWDTIEMDVIVLKTVNPNDSYDKYKAVDLITKDANLQKANLDLLSGALKLAILMPSKYQDARVKYNCNSTGN